MAESDCSLVPHKVCSSCSISQPIEEFPSRGIDKRRPHRPATRYGRCATCLREAAVRNCNKRKATKEGAAKEAKIRKDWACKNRHRWKSYRSNTTNKPRAYRISKSIRSERQEWIDQGRIKAKTHAWKDWLSNASDDWLDNFYISTGKPWNDHRLLPTEKMKLRRKLDPEFAAYDRLRSAMRKQAKDGGVGECMRGAIKAGNKSGKIESICGYTIAQLVYHLESLFSAGMTWERFNTGEIHIDHIIPKSVFDVSIREELLDCWSLDNLRPMWAKDNLVKRDSAVAYESDPVLWMKYGSRIAKNKVLDEPRWAA